MGTGIDQTGSPPSPLRQPSQLTASAWKPALGRDPGTGKIEKGCHSVALMAGQLTWMYAPTLNWYPLRDTFSTLHSFMRFSTEQ